MITSRFYVRLSPILKVFSSTSSINMHCKIHNVGNLSHITLVSASVFKIKKLPLPLNTWRCMAGHAKWQNIKGIKTQKDREKSTLCNKYVRAVTAAVREKGPDPKANIRLAQILEEAKKNNVPSATLQNALKKGNNKKLQFGTIEMLGPGGCIVIFEYESDNICDLRRSIKIVCRKHGAGIFPGNSERWRAAYEQKGIIRVTKLLNGESIDSEKMLDAAIEAGAEDVQKIEEEDLYEFLCAPEDINIVKKELEQTFAVEEAFVGYLPMSTVTLSGEDKTLALNFINELAELPDVSRIFENVE